MTFADDIAAGTHNLLVNCAGLKSGETVLIIGEDPALGWYDAAAPLIVAEAARSIGAKVTMLAVGMPENDADPAVISAIAAHDCTIYFARIGDQVRFAEALPGKRSVMCYVRDREMLGSAYSTASYAAFKELKQAVDDVLLAAGNIEITCPRGTRISGKASETTRREKVDVSVFRFPLGVPLPLDATGFTGQVALAHFLTPTGSKSYEPASVALTRSTLADVENGRITGFKGDNGQVALIRAHYAMVSNRFNIDPDVVHSWHAGIHPGSAYGPTAAEDPDRWSNSAFTNPRFVHFHTCGDYPPGEISWMVLDHTIAVDGVNLWDGGRLRPGAFAQTNRCLENWPELNALFDAPSDLIGLPV